MPTDRIALISGSSKGLGGELAKFLQRQNFNVVTMGFESASTVDIRCDLSDIDQTEVSIRSFFGDNKRIDLLVCNAGSGKVPHGDLNEIELNEYFLIKNFVTAYNFIQSTAKYLSKGSSVIGISSIAALKNIETAPVGYRIAKQELNKLFFAKAKEYARKDIRFNLISPGNLYFKNSRWEELERENPKLVEDLLTNQVPTGSFISPEEIGEAIMYLSSDAAKNITGANLVIDGGQSIE
jgi:3-oxoacyl-[acyl-carrier protein] reductase